MSTKTYTTAEAARAVGVTRATLQTWIVARKIQPPRLKVVNGRATRIWTQEDVSRLREAKKIFYGKGGRPKKKPNA